MDDVLSTTPALTLEVARRVLQAAPLVTVYGEPMLDGWWHGTSTRLAREAPAPIVALGAKDEVPGGAANTAMNLAALGARVRFVGLVGEDEAGASVRAALAEAGVDVTFLLSDSELRTITKTRIVVADQVLVRLDEGNDSGYPPQALGRLAAAAVAASEGADAEIVCDYGTGMLTGPVHDALASRSSRPPVLLVDAREDGGWADLSPDLVTPNAEETAALMGVPLKRGTDRVATVTDRADRLLAVTGATAAVVTLDRDGTVLLDGTGTVHRTWARPASDKQASGAGDTFAAALTLARATGLPLAVSADFAQAAADVVVGRSGTSVCSGADLLGHLARFADAALSADDLARRLAAERAAGRRIVFTNGCFDVLHRGHTAYLNQAKRLGDVLVVAINSDDSVRRLKGESRPINAAPDRAEVLASLSCVDYVTIFTTDTPIPLLERIRPDVYAKGGDYTVETLPESPVVQSYGGEVRILDYLADYSTTAVVDRIRTPASATDDVVRLEPRSARATRAPRTPRRAGL
ncbi:D-glycero-beta-D-manno-heptose 1-phosphate adenylyltransferase [Naasia sp. SYSU D00057]|uniref:D-glycero-beta-D-manno-heptose 1-phosphate adenylyltransferase n=1 Tax=Naasia sp. SYSU D00057 TaxID=2817380 RepID=UPI001B302986|nr:D-glycero-beta-D-manno-heptose 1-phosphate adenylyltransferase [Naasia sp. SYSU D00057]